MELTASNPRATLEARRKMVFLLAGLWIGGLVVFGTTAMQNWGALAVAVGFSVFQWFTRPKKEDTFKIAFCASGLSITYGRNFLWGASVEELTGAVIAEESKKWGIVLSPRRVTFYKSGGDQYSIGTDFFDQGQMAALVEEIQHNISLKADASRSVMPL